MPKKNLLKTAIFSFALILITSANAKTYAEESSVTNPTVGIKISPPIAELKIAKGQTDQNIIKIENDGKNNLTLYPQVMSFIAKGEDGSQEFIPPEEDDTSYSLAKWINISKDPITLSPQERTAINYSVTIPENAEAGGRYAVIFFSTKPTENIAGSEVKLAFQTGTIILTQIDGPVTERGSIAEFSIDKTFYQYLPVNFVTRFKNTGDIHQKPTGKIEIKNLFGQKVDEIIVNEKLGNVLPQSIRRFENTWNNDKFNIGKYTATLTLSYGNNETYNLVEQVSFWVLPIKEILIGLLALIILVVLIILIIRKYNAWIIKKALANQQPKTENNQEPQQ